MRVCLGAAATGHWTWPGGERSAHFAPGAAGFIAHPCAIPQRLADLKRRIAENARVQDGEVPAEDPSDLLEEADRVLARIRRLIVAVNTTNAATRMADGTTVTEVLARREELGARARLLKEAAEHAGERMRRYGLSEIREVATLDVKELRDKADRLAAERRALDLQLRQLNWTTDLVVDA